MGRLFELLDRVITVLEGEAASPVRVDDDTVRHWQREFGLSDLEVDLALLAMLPEADSRFAASFADLQPAFGIRRPTLGLAAELLCPKAHALELRDELLRGSLWSCGLLEPFDDLPFFDRPLVPTAALSYGLSGLCPTQIGDVLIELVHPSNAARLSLSHAPRFADEVAELNAWAARAERPCVVAFDGTVDSWRVTEALALHAEAPIIRAWGTMGHAAVAQLIALAVAHDAVLWLQPAHQRTLPLPTGLRWSRPVVCATEIEFEGPVQRRSVRTGRLTPAESYDIWTGVLPDSDAQTREALAGKTHLLPSEIVALSEVLVGTEALATSDAVASVTGVPQSPLARTKLPRATFEDLVVSAACRETLQRIVRNTRLRTVVDREGMLPPALVNTGNVVALFYGESGTGKTLAAEALANALAMPLMVVDVSRVTSKYIGETEERLDALFAQAEGFRAVLFLDEADSFFGSRTSISDANDRYANLETNYLLQRVEAFEGVAVLATNLRRNIDAAFSRRFQFMAQFERPSPAHRIAIWRRHLADADALDRDLGGALAELDVVGGDIRNICVEAVFEAADLAVPLNASILEQCIRRELMRSGQRIPDFLGARNA